jgi:hypothetical protein
MNHLSNDQRKMLENFHKQQINVLFVDVPKKVARGESGNWTKALANSIGHPLLSLSEARLPSTDAQNESEKSQCMYAEAKWIPYPQLSCASAFMFQQYRRKLIKAPASLQLVVERHGTLDYLFFLP